MLIYLHRNQKLDHISRNLYNSVNWQSYRSLDKKSLKPCSQCVTGFGKCAQRVPSEFGSHKCIIIFITLRYDHFFLFNALSGSLFVGWLLVTPYDPEKAWLSGYIPIRFIQVLVIQACVIILLNFADNIRRETELGKKAYAFLEGSGNQAVKSRGIEYLFTTGILLFVFYLFSGLVRILNGSVVYFSLFPLMGFQFLVCLSGLFYTNNQLSNIISSITPIRPKLKKLNQEYFINWILILVLLLFGSAYTILMIISGVLK